MPHPFGLSRDVIHAVVAVLFRPPLADATGEAADVDEVDDLVERIRAVGVVGYLQIHIPVGKLAAETDVRYAHAHAHHVLAHGRRAALDLRKQLGTITVTLAKAE